MKYKKGDKIVYFNGTEIVEDEIMLVVTDFVRPYYHTYNDEYLNDETIVGIIVNGVRYLNESNSIARQYEQVQEQFLQMWRWLNETNKI